MIYEVELSEQADSDLRGIFEYISFELQSPENASGQLDRLEEQILSLDTMPERYRKYEKEPWKSRGLRVLPVYRNAFISQLSRPAGLPCEMRWGTFLTAF